MKQFGRAQYLITFSSLILVAFIISISVYAVKNKDSYHVIMFYPSVNNSEKDIIDRKVIPDMGGKEENIKIFLQYFSFGPGGSTEKRLVGKDLLPDGMAPDFVMINGKDLFLDYPYEFVTGEKEKGYDLEVAIKYMEKSLRKNFSNLKNIIFTVHGNVIELPEPEEVISESVGDDLPDLNPEEIAPTE